jgi:catechol 2,3-dioxygenase-like lactoylglutathione lyase family enzyme
MRNNLICLALGALICFAATSFSEPERSKEDKKMRLGNFSVSLTVKDLAKSKEFYEKLGFRGFGGNAKNWVILQNDTCTIGLFQGMFEKNMLTFNPGWDRTAATLPDFDDVRDLQKALLDKGLTLKTKADEASTGPASFIVVDPDGNPILVDQHVAKPKK